MKRISWLWLSVPTFSIAICGCINAVSNLFIQFRVYNFPHLDAANRDIRIVAVASIVFFITILIYNIVAINKSNGNKKGDNYESKK